MSSDELLRVRREHAARFSLSKAGGAATAPAHAACLADCQ